MSEPQKKAESKMSSEKQIKITFPDGSEREFEKGITALEVARSISSSLAKAVIIAEIDGREKDLSCEIHENVSLRLIRRQDDQALEYIRHDAAHVMAQAVQELYPGTQVTIGPTIENGFYYDFGRNQPFSTEDLEKIEEKMHEIVNQGEAFHREVWERDHAISFFKEKGEYYKAEIIEDLPEDEDVSVYRQGQWLDLCRGPHMPSTRHIGHAFKLMKVAGAYWRGDSNKAMLTRIYGTAWRDEKELDAYLHMLEEAEKRDHRKLGQQMSLFHFQEEAQGSVFWHPKGFVLYNQMEGYIRRRLRDAGYVEVKTPQLIDNKLWEKSGHWGKFRENMFVVPDEVPNVEEEGPVISGEGRLMAIKPMNCPAHVQIFNQGIKSYRDLPVRMAEFGCCHRNEAHGALHGLMRVRQMTQDDAHIFCREDQVTDESVAFCDLLQKVYNDMGFENIEVKLATRPEVRAGDDSVWDKAEKGLEDALKKAGLSYEIIAGEGAFYGPKLEFHLKDAIGRTWQCGTLQLDFVLPERLESSYIGEDGDKHRPVMLHRAILGSLERFIGILIENHAGKMPLWLAPVQCVIATITSDAEEYANELYEQMFELGLRVELDKRNEKISYKVREHSVAKVPVIFVIGKKEAEEKTVSIRRLGEKDVSTQNSDEAINELVLESKPPY
jgi:threonyl-tRNA synthetase